MKLHNSHGYVIGCAIALGIGCTTIAGAQQDSTKKDTTRKVTSAKTTTTKAAPAKAKTTTKRAVSTTRIPVTKETSGGDVALPKDTAVVAAPTPAPEPAPPPPPVVDTAMTAPTPEPAPPAPEPAPIPVARKSLGNFYIGIGAGGSVPVDNMRNGYNTGWNTTGVLGWDSREFPLGIRADVGYDRLMGRESIGVMGDIATYTGNIDAKLRLGSFMSHLYAIGGVGASKVVGYGGNALYSNGTTYTGTYPVGSANMASSFSNAPTEMNWNAGGGMEFGFGHSSLFIESRYFHVNSENSLGASTRYVPIILGIMFH